MENLNETCLHKETILIADQEIRSDRRNSRAIFKCENCGKIFKQ